MYHVHDIHDIVKLKKKLFLCVVLAVVLVVVFVMLVAVFVVVVRAPKNFKYLYLYPVSLFLWPCTLCSIFYRFLQSDNTTSMFDRDHQLLRQKY